MCSLPVGIHYVGLSIHYIDDNWNLYPFILSLKSYNLENQTSLMVRKFVDDCLDEYGLRLTDDIYIVTDNENKMKCCFQKGAKRIGCADHYLNKLVEHAFTGKHDRAPEVLKLFLSVKEIVVHVRRSHRQAALSKKVQTYSDTRFVGAFIMLESFLNVITELGQVLEREYLLRFADIDVDLLRQIHLFMQPFSDVIEELSHSSRPTLHRVIPLRQYLIDCCDPHVDDEDGLEKLKLYLSNNAALCAIH